MAVSLTAVRRHGSFSTPDSTTAMAVRTGSARRASPRVLLRAIRPDHEYDAVVIGSGMGGLAVAGKLSSAGASVLVLEKYIQPGGSASWFSREDNLGHWEWDVGSSMMFGLNPDSTNTTTNLITKALESVGKSIATVPDPSQVFYHLPNQLDVRVHRKYEDFIAELVGKFPHEEEGIKKFYGDCWKVFNSLNSIELKSLEEPRYLMQQFFRAPMACLTLASFLGSNTGTLARKYIRDEELLRFIDMECYIFSTVLAEETPTINAGMVFCDRHYGGINYPVGGVGKIPQLMAEGIQELGGDIEYKANVKKILVNGEGRAHGVQLADGRCAYGKTIVSNATRWDTFEGMLKGRELPESEKSFREKYVKSPSFVSIHIGIREIDSVCAKNGTDCHHILLEDWSTMLDSLGTLFVSIPSLLDPSLCPDGTHTFHCFSPSWMHEWEGLSGEEYLRKKDEVADEIVRRLEAVFPGLSEAIISREVATPRTHRKFLNRVDGTYGPVPSRRPFGMLGFPFNTTDVEGLYCTGDSTFPGQGVNAVVFSGFGCAHRILVDLDMEEAWPAVDELFNAGLKAVRRAV